MSLGAICFTLDLTVNYPEYLNMKTSSNSHASELNPPENITPSIGTTINGILILLPLTLVLVGLFSHVINP